MSVGALAGGVRAVLDGRGIGTTPGILGIKILGLALAIAWFVAYAQER
ncbi:hypothetical protein ACIBCU_32675 [Streptomyces sp. NPDC051064]